MRIVFASLPASWYVAAVLAILAAWWAVMRVRRGMGVWRLRFYALPRPWVKYLHEHVPLYERLPWELRAPYQDKVLQFVDAKGFRPCGAIDEVTEEMRVVIAGNACLLLLNGSGEENFPGVLTVQVYPPGDPDPGARSSCVAMHWDADKKQATDPSDKGNAALPAIALRLGWEVAGQPVLPEPLLLTAWARVRSAEFTKRHNGVLERAAGTAVHPVAGLTVSAARLGTVPAGSGRGGGTPPGSAARPGGTTENPDSETHAAAQFEPAEIFAVATEMFLGAPAVLRQRQPELYAAMRLFYQIDPARWTTPK